jgi:hypothetical protein
LPVTLAGTLSADPERLGDRHPTDAEATEARHLKFHSRLGLVAGGGQFPQLCAGVRRAPALQHSGLRPVRCRR